MVRPATAADIPALVALGHVMHAEAAALRHATFDEAKVERALSVSISHGCAFVHEAEGAIDGAFCAVLVERWFSTDRYVTDLGLFVRPDRRGGLTACRLLDAFLFWCERMKIPPADVVIGVSTGVHVEATGQLYERLGFRRVGGVYQLGAY